MTDPRNEHNLDRELHQLSDHLRDAPAPPGLADRLAAALPAAVTPVRPLPSLAVRALVLFALVAAVALALGFGAGGHGWEALEPDQQYSLAALLAAGAVWLAWELAAQMSPAPYHRWSSLVPPAVALVAALAWIAWETPHDGDAPLFYPACLAFTAEATLAAAALAWLWLRRGFTMGRSGLALAAAVALAGFGAVQFFCPYVDAAHILTSHVLPAVAVGALVGTVVWARAK